MLSVEILRHFEVKANTRELAAGRVVNLLPSAARVNDFSDAGRLSYIDIIEYKLKISTRGNKPMTILYEGRVYEPARWGAPPGKGRRYQQQGWR